MDGSYNDKLITDEEDQQGQGAGAGQMQASGTSGVVTGGTQGQGVSTAGVGAGGTGGWTNIQAYLGANKTNQDSANLLNNKAMGQYDAENNALNTSANETKTQAQNEANKINEAKDKSKEWVNQAANAYSWTGNQGSDYTNNANKVKSAITDTYKGPENFAYQKSADFQRTGSALGNDQSFGNYMNDIYKQKAGGQLSKGQGALQTQLDVNNQGLADARKNLLDKYSGFDSNIQKAVTDSDTAIQKAKQDYGNNQASLKDYLGNMSNDYQMQIDKAENDARSGYNTSLTGDKSGLTSAYYSSQFGDDPMRDAFSSKDAYGDNQTWKQLENESELAKDKSNIGSTYHNYAGILNNGIFGNTAPSDRFKSNQSALNNFYSQQDQKYANTADNEERNWNTIMDILGKSDRKQEGFKVRGV